MAVLPSTNRHGLGAPDMRPFDARWPCPFAPLSTLHLPPHGDRRMTRGESGWLVLPFYRTLTGCPSPVGLALARVVADHPRWPLSSECFSRCRYLLRPLRLLPVGATVTGRDSHPLRNGALHGARRPNGYPADLRTCGLRTPADVTRKRATYRAAPQCVRARLGWWRRARRRRRRRTIARESCRRACRSGEPPPRARCLLVERRVGTDDGRLVVPIGKNAAGQVPRALQHRPRPASLAAPKPVHDRVFGERLPGRPVRRCLTREGVVVLSVRWPAISRITGSRFKIRDDDRCVQETLNRLQSRVDRLTGSIPSTAQNLSDR